MKMNREHGFIQHHFYSGYKSGAGFTLIELLVVISIVSLLASVVYASLSNARGKATVAAGQQFSGQVKRALYDKAAIYLDFDSLAVGANLTTELSKNNQGTLVLPTAITYQTGTASLTTDTTLYKRGNHLIVNAAPTYGIIYSPVSGLNTIMESLNYTLSGWLLVPAGVSGTVVIVGEDVAGSGNYGVANLKACLSNGNVTGVTANYPNNGGQLVVPSSGCEPVSVPSGQWVHLAVSVKNKNNGTVDITFFANGKQLNTYNKSAAYSGANASFFIGSGGNANYQFDEVAIFSQALTASDFHAIYAAGAAEHGLAVK
ncbi:MAG: hypothetical protein A3C06_03200 [Candidatus Taylorbacteria bacterium RIFCSPHIGHO2_02_FULL_46_13]|uniref:LamG-like jellyroll fold domain-containing protein n=1 Tax=Candidatus Taylorbacteria bacterium RIFCSPHIGHO2_02_FULL_46_13 TaxID=1802312 RepID=A0A1G2MRN1_9BACT|nr:MAG: hypothetical protein A3C06_03200 [Candidatus Taylorbacteria bacterium RIFCSPHIGHO2_02_FULL_46_13]